MFNQALPIVLLGVIVVILSLAVLGVSRIFGLGRIWRFLTARPLGRTVPTALPMPVPGGVIRFKWIVVALVLLLSVGTAFGMSVSGATGGFTQAEGFFNLSMITVLGGGLLVLWAIVEATLCLMADRLSFSDRRPTRLENAVKFIGILGGVIGLLPYTVASIAVRFPEPSLIVTAFEFIAVGTVVQAISALKLPRLHERAKKTSEAYVHLYLWVEYFAPWILYVGLWYAWAHALPGAWVPGALSLIGFSLFGVIYLTDWLNHDKMPDLNRSEARQARGLYIVVLIAALVIMFIPSLTPDLRLLLEIGDTLVMMLAFASLAFVRRNKI